jgi:hypothetical protein
LRLSTSQIKKMDTTGVAPSSGLKGTGKSKAKGAGKSAANKGVGVTSGPTKTITKSKK